MNKIMIFTCLLLLSHQTFAGFWIRGEINPQAAEITCKVHNMTHSTVQAAVIRYYTTNNQHVWHSHEISDRSLRWPIMPPTDTQKLSLEDVNLTNKISTRCDVYFIK